MLPQELKPQRGAFNGHVLVPLGRETEVVIEAGIFIVADADASGLEQSYGRGEHP